MVRISDVKRQIIPCFSYFMFESSLQMGEQGSKYKPMFFIVLFILLAVTYYEIVKYNSAATELVFNTTSEVSDIQVDVSGAVVSPGVYSLTSEKRLGEALALAGGFSPQANVKWVSSNINLSKKLMDEQKVYIPFEWETESEDLVVARYDSIEDSSTTTLVNLNTASKEELISISGIGEVYASKIIEQRPYTKISDLESRGVLGPSLIEKVTPYVTL